MVKAMSGHGLSASKGTENKVIEVWNKLDGATKRLTTAKGAKAREILADLARDLISPSRLRCLIAGSSANITKKLKAALA